MRSCLTHDLILIRPVPPTSSSMPSPGKRLSVPPVARALTELISRNAYNVIVALKGQDWAVETLDKLPEGVQPQISVEELLLCEEIIRADERVVKLAAEVGKSLDLARCDGGSSTSRCEA